MAKGGVTRTIGHDARDGPRSPGEARPQALLVGCHGLDAAFVQIAHCGFQTSETMAVERPRLEVLGPGLGLERIGGMHARAALEQRLDVDAGCRDETACPRRAE